MSAKDHKEVADSAAALRMLAELMPTVQKAFETLTPPQQKRAARLLAYAVGALK